MGIVLYDDDRARQFEPFSLTRPVGELRAGGELIRRRWETQLGERSERFVSGRHLSAFEELEAPHSATAALPAGTILVNTRCVPMLSGPASDRGRATAWMCDGRLAALRLTSALPLDLLADGKATLDSLIGPGGTPSVIEGWWLEEVWDLVRHLNTMLALDALALDPMADASGKAFTVIGEHPVRVDPSAEIEPFVVADATAGPILVRRGAVVQAFTRLVGPCIIGEDSTVSGGRVASCSIGDRVKVNGEISASIIIGHANKGHDGFVGHSILGRWTNLGAGTITSNLKNSYGMVSAWTPSGVRDTGLQFLGTLMGDHAKTGIGTRLTTGCVIGAGANLFGTAMPPKVVAPFSWGETGAFEVFALDKFLQVAERVMSRRGVKLSAGERAQLKAAHAARWRA